MANPQGIEVLTRAHEYLGEVATGAPRPAWGAPTPCTEWTVRQVLSHADRPAGLRSGDHRRSPAAAWLPPDPCGILTLAAQRLRAVTGAYRVPVETLAPLEQARTAHELPERPSDRGEIVLAAAGL